ncbi:MAG: chorismate-binding protein [Candidatus Micrarchaeia archaeon]
MVLNFKAHLSEMPARGLSPTDAYLRIVKKYGRKYSFFLESIFDEESTILAKRFSRLSIIPCEPILTIMSKNGRCFLEGKFARIISEEIVRTGTFEYDNGFLLDGKDPLHFLNSVVGMLGAETGLSRFSFGPIGYISYDVVRYLEKLPDRLPDTLNLPEMYFVLHKNAIVFDHASNRVLYVVHAYEDEDAFVGDLVELANNGEKAELGEDARETCEIKSNTTKAEFIKMVLKAKEYLRSGDIFQVVLSRRVGIKTRRDPIRIYFDLRKINPSPYMFYLDFGDFQLIGASPEVHVRVEKGLIEMRPIAGTRGRGRTESEERELEEELLKSEKERAEHTMLVDLCRNDIGRVAEFGSVKEPELFTVEKYSHVQHLVSHITGNLRANKNAFDVFRATFPSGTVSGAPKVRAMEIIEELEKERRGPYAGVVGYFDVKGNSDMCITIRTLIMKDGIAYAQAGAGIVYDSEPEAEWVETRKKLNACVKAVTGKEMDES